MENYVQGKETKSLKAFVASKAQPGETVIAHLDGWTGEMMGKGKDTQHNGSLILTEQRVVFYGKAMFGETFQAVPLRNMASVETRTSAGRRILALHSSNDALVFKTFEAAELFDSFYAEIENRRTPSSITPVTTAPSAADEIVRFGALRDQGLITEEEFSAKKRQLLGL